MPPLRTETSSPAREYNPLALAPPRIVSNIVRQIAPLPCTTWKPPIDVPSPVGCSYSSTPYLDLDNTPSTSSGLLVSEEETFDDMDVELFGPEEPSIDPASSAPSPMANLALPGRSLSPPQQLRDPIAPASPSTSIGSIFPANFPLWSASGTVVQSPRAHHRASPLAPSPPLTLPPRGTRAQIDRTPHPFPLQHHPRECSTIPLPMSSSSAATTDVSRPMKRRRPLEEPALHPTPSSPSQAMSDRCAPSQRQSAIRPSTPHSPSPWSADKTSEPPQKRARLDRDPRGGTPPRSDNSQQPPAVVSPQSDMLVPSMEALLGEGDRVNFVEPAEFGHHYSPEDMERIIPFKLLPDGRYPAETIDFSLPGPFSLWPQPTYHDPPLLAAVVQNIARFTGFCEWLKEYKESLMSRPWIDAHEDARDPASDVPPAIPDDSLVVRHDSSVTAVPSETINPGLLLHQNASIAESTPPSLTVEALLARANSSTTPNVATVSPQSWPQPHYIDGSAKTVDESGYSTGYVLDEVLETSSGYDASAASGSSDTGDDWTFNNWAEENAPEFLHESQYGPEPVDDSDDDVVEVPPPAGYQPQPRRPTSPPSAFLKYSHENSVETFASRAAEMKLLCPEEHEGKPKYWYDLLHPLEKDQGNTQNSQNGQEAQPQSNASQSDTSNQPTREQHTSSSSGAAPSHAQASSQAGPSRVHAMTHSHLSDLHAHSQASTSAHVSTYVWTKPQPGQVASKRGQKRTHWEISQSWHSKAMNSMPCPSTQPNPSTSQQTHLYGGQSALSVGASTLHAYGIASSSRSHSHRPDTPDYEDEDGEHWVTCRWDGGCGEKVPRKLLWKHLRDRHQKRDGPLESCLWSGCKRKGSLKHLSKHISGVHGGKNRKKI